MHPVLITKADGEREPFRAEKLERSLERAGASSTMRAKIVDNIMRELRDGMYTEDIYRRAFELLRQQEIPPVAARYSMKRAVFALGPSGFPFELFFAEILHAYGWSVRADVILRGRCASHEVDVVAEREGRRVGVEAKFHNDPGGKTDIKDVLYVHARYHDLGNAPDARERVDEGWLVTNTRFTKNAINYAQCSNLTIIAWDYPKNRGLLSMIEETRVHPLTALTTLSEAEKRRLMEKKIVLCKHILTPHLLEEYGIKPSSIPDVIEEARHLCGT
ncbi:MAG TPA: restriction endonuclease [Candidatus Paceibacterota bacterium]